MRDFLELTVDLLETPSKLRKIIALIGKVVLNLIFSEWLYKTFVGSYTLNDILNWDQWVEFLLSGKVFLCTLLYFTSDVVLFHLLPFITNIPIKFLGRKRVKKKQDLNEYGFFITWYLKSLELLHINKEEKRIDLMDNSDVLYELATDFKKKETRREVRSIKDSIVELFIHPLIVFLILYFTILEDIPHNTFLNTLLWIFLIVAIVTYFSACILMDIALLLSDDLIWMIDTAKMENLAIEYLNKNEIFLTTPHQKEKLYDHYFFHNENMIGVQYTMSKINSRRLEEFKNYAEEAKMFFLILFRIPRDMKRPKEPFDNTQGHIRIIIFREQNELEMELQMLIDNNFYLPAKNI